MSLHVSFTRYSNTKANYFSCPTCKSAQLMCSRFQDWYGWTITCTGCGERWQNGEMMPRPFMRGWRKANIAEATKALAAVREDPRCDVGTWPFDTGRRP